MLQEASTFVLQECWLAQAQQAAYQFCYYLTGMCAGAILSVTSCALDSC
jgi:hypothetical protein